MNPSPQIVSPDVRPDSYEFALKEQKKIKGELLEKYREKLLRATWWKTVVIRLRISREIGRIFRSRLYLASKIGGPKPN
jgi:hypothetical protein